MPKQRPYGSVLPASSQQRRAPGGGSASPDGAKAPQIPYRQPRKGRISRVVLGIAFIVLVLSLLALGAIVFSYWQGQQSYKEVAQEAYPAAQGVFAQSEVDLEAASEGIDWDALRAINPDTVAWIYVPGTPVNYPVVQTSNNVTYLSTDFRGEHGWLAQFGCIFVAAENEPGFADRNNVLFGHHMNDGSMFGFIDGLFDAAKFNATRDIYLLTPDGNYHLRTFSLFRCEPDEPIAQVSFSSTEEYAAYVQDTIDRSEVAPSEAVDAASITKTFMFATCDHNGRDLRQVLYASVVESTAPEKTGAVSDARPAVDAARELAGS